MFLQNNSNNKLARIKTLNTGTFQNVYTNPNKIEHPFITADGYYMIYGRERNGGINVYTKNLKLGTTRRLASASNPRNLLAMTWVQPSTMVTNTNDSGEGSLRQVIADAKSGDVITFDTVGMFATTQTISLKSQLDIDKNISIKGTGAKSLKLNIDSNTRIFYIYPAVTVMLDSMTIKEGKAKDSGNAGDNSTLGGGIYNEGLLTLQKSIVIDNKATKGGGIYNGNLGILTIEQSYILSNNNSTQYGGAIYNKGRLTIRDSIIRHNEAVREGGGIYNHADGYITIIRSQIESNSSYASGGGISNKGTLNILDNSIITSNRADSNTADGAIEYGAGIYSHGGNVNIDNSTIESNEAPNGGGIAIIDGELIINASLVSGNIVRRSGGGIYNKGLNSTLIIQGGTIIKNNISSFGSGVYNSDGGFATIAQSYIQDNSTADQGTVNGGVGGGIYNGPDFNSNGGVSSLTITGSYIDSNSAINGGGIYNLHNLILVTSNVTGNLGSAEGGGIYTKGILQILVNSQINENTALSGGGIYIAESGEATINTSTIGGNQSTDANHGFIGGGVYNLGTVTINTTGKVIGNQADEKAGGVYNEGTLNNQGTVANNTPEDIISLP